MENLNCFEDNDIISKFVQDICCLFKLPHPCTNLEQLKCTRKEYDKLKQLTEVLIINDKKTHTYPWTLKNNLNSKNDMKILFDYLLEIINNTIEIAEKPKMKTKLLEIYVKYNIYLPN